jgi:UDP:flavonoid glycosyltransferase YjiC (YdhE family)
MATEPAMRVLFCTTGGVGHLLPLRSLATALRDQGHQVAWVTAPDALPVLQGDGFELFAAGPTFGDSRAQFRATYADAARLVGEPLSAYTFPRLFGAVLAPAMLEGIDQAIGGWRPDFVVHEPAALAAPLACTRRGVRHVAHGYGLRLSQRHLDDSMSFFGSHWRAHGLEAPADGGLYRHLYLDIVPASLEPTTVSSSGVFRFNTFRSRDKVLPSLPAELQAALDLPAATRPRIYVTFGTVFNRSPALITAARAAARLGGTVVVTVGCDGDLQALAELGRHVHLQRFVDQAAVLRHCDMVVSHGGAGTVLGAAWQGLPHLVLPQSADHFRNARALSRVNAGRAVEPACQGMDDVTSAMSAVLQDEKLQLCATAIAQEMEALPDATAAVKMLERWHAYGAVGSK